MNGKEFTLPEGAKKLTPLDMNKLAILKAHTVITFTPSSPNKNKSSNS